MLVLRRVRRRTRVTSCTNCLKLHIVCACVKDEQNSNRQRLKNIIYVHYIRFLRKCEKHVQYIVVIYYELIRVTSDTWSYSRDVNRRVRGPCVYVCLLLCVCMSSRRRSYTMYNNIKILRRFGVVQTRLRRLIYIRVTPRKVARGVAEAASSTTTSTGEGKCV